jgi:ferric-dicitrate binding protein FerR (iron transport regulator)
MGTMTHDHEPAVPDVKLPEDGDQIASLLRLASPREAIPPERALRVKAAVRTEWRRQSRARARRVTMGWSFGALAAAALVLIGTRVALRDTATPPGPERTVAIVETLSGAVRLMNAPEGATALAHLGDTLRPGNAVDTTTGGRAAVRLTGGTAVRVDSGSRVHLVSDAALVLDEGTVYVDSGAGGTGTLEVRTPLGVARDIGTRFEVRVEASTLRVRVRDGFVQLKHGRQSHDAKAGEEVTLDRQGSVIRRTVPVYGPAWAWTATLAKPFELEGRLLREFLDWICEENGWRLRFASTASERVAATATLHGSIQGFTPEEALAAVLPTTGVEHQLENGVLVIGLSSSDRKR